MDFFQDLKEKDSKFKYLLSRSQKRRECKQQLKRVQIQGERQLFAFLDCYLREQHILSVTEYQVRGGKRVSSYLQYSVRLY